MENGKWKMENGKLKIENGDWRIESSQPECLPLKSPPL
jgi:hypothetical protein